MAKSISLSFGAEFVYEVDDTGGVKTFETTGNGVKFSKESGDLVVSKGGPTGGTPEMIEGPFQIGYDTDSGKLFIIGEADEVDYKEYDLDSFSAVTVELVGENLQVKTLSLN